MVVLDVGKGLQGCIFCTIRLSWFCKTAIEPLSELIVMKKKIFMYP